MAIFWLQGSRRRPSSGCRGQGELHKGMWHLKECRGKWDCDRHTEVVSEAKPAFKESLFFPWRIIQINVLEFLLSKGPKTLLPLNLSLFLSCSTQVILFGNFLSVTDAHLYEYLLGSGPAGDLVRPGWQGSDLCPQTVCPLLLEINIHAEHSMIGDVQKV